MTIAALPPNVAGYIVAFDLSAVAVTRDGRLIATRDPSGCARAWWASARDIGQFMRHWADMPAKVTLQLERPISQTTKPVAMADLVDIPTTAAALGIVVTEHSEVLARAHGRGKPDRDRHGAGSGCRRAQ
jgi:hypothetical protein